MGKFNKGCGSRSFGRSLSSAFRENLDFTYGGHSSRKNAGLADTLTQSLAREVIAPGNNRPGHEFLRCGWKTNVAGMISQELSNRLVRGTPPTRKKWR